MADKVKLTKAQREVLTENDRLAVSVITGNVWGKQGGFSVKIRSGTFSALLDRGCYEIEQSEKLTRHYSITPLGLSLIGGGE